jgi:hypothetical protein
VFNNSVPPTVEKKITLNSVPHELIIGSPHHKGRFSTIIRFIIKVVKNHGSAYWLPKSNYLRCNIL